ILQSVFKSFFVRFEHGEFDVQDWNDLWSLLTVLTVRKCSRAARHFHRESRTVEREMTHSPAPDDGGIEWPALSREPTPDEAAILTETVEQLMRQLDQQQQHILTLTLQGAGITEVSAELGCTERKVYRVLKFAREWLEGEFQKTE